MRRDCFRVARMPRTTLWLTLRAQRYGLDLSIRELARIARVRKDTITRRELAWHSRRSAYADEIIAAYSFTSPQERIVRLWYDQCVEQGDVARETEQELQDLFLSIVDGT